MSGSMSCFVPYAEYRQCTALNISALKEIKHSPQNYQYRLQYPRQSKAMQLGNAAHCAVLEPARFAADYVIWDRVTESGQSAPRRGQFWNEFQERHAGKSIITPKDYNDAKGLADAIREDAIAMKYLRGGEPEVVMQWRMYDRECKGRLDWLTEVEGRPCIVGLKTARDCRPLKFGNDAARLLYHAQWAWYFDGHKEITGKEPIMIEIAVESKAPHSVVTYVIPEEVIQQGREDYLKLLDKLSYCEDENYWPGPGDNCEQILSLPVWAYTPSDSDLSDLDIEV